MKNIFIIGCKGIPANYGGFETFTDNLITREKNKNIQYYVSCLSDNYNKQNSFYYNGAICKNIYVPNIGGAKAILYDVKSLNWALSEINDRKLTKGYIYILGCTIGPLINVFKGKFEKKGFKFYLNPDGHEWERDKWSFPVKKYLKLSEISMIKAADLTICDSVAIEDYINSNYKKYNPTTKYISYGSDIKKSELDNNSYKVKKFFSEFSIEPKQYYLVVGRFVPENNYETIINQFMSSKTNRDLVIITNYKSNIAFYRHLKAVTRFDKDKRIKFVGTVYDQSLLKFIRENCFAYIHGHSVGGTNPSLLEALGSTDLNLLFDVVFNREVAKDAALYWNTENDSLTQLINRVDRYDSSIKDKFATKAKKVIKERYSWDKIIKQYETLFI